MYAFVLGYGCVFLCSRGLDYFIDELRVSIHNNNVRIIYLSFIIIIILCVCISIADGKLVEGPGGHNNSSSSSQRDICTTCLYVYIISGPGGASSGVSSRPGAGLFGSPRRH